MKISVKQTKKDVFSLSLGDTTVTLDKPQMKKLLLDAVTALMPGGAPLLDPKKQAHALAAKLRGANPAGLQQFILAARDDDVLLFLKSNEDDSAFINTMFANMSARTQSMFKEDMEFRFKDGVPDDDLANAVIELGEIADKLVSDEMLKLG